MKLEDITCDQMWHILNKASFDELEDVIIDLDLYPLFNTREEFLDNIRCEFDRIYDKKDYREVNFLHFRILTSLKKIDINLDSIEEHNLDDEYSARDLVFKLSENRAKNLREALIHYEKGL